MQHLITRPVKVIDYSKITLQQLLKTTNSKLKRNAISIIKMLIANKGI